MPEVKLPEKWSEWKVIEQVGMGSFGTVYKAERKLGSNCFYSAIKVIRIPLEEQDIEILRREYKDEQSIRLYYGNLVQACIEEIHTMDQLKGNSNIVSIEDYYVEELKEKVGWVIYIRMEYLQNLAQYIQVTQLDEKQIVQIGIDICNALEQCEKLQIVHRDIKIDNIFVSSLGCYKLGDFGIARKLEQSVGSYSSKGTFSYMAPEVYHGEHYGMQADVYSLGLVIYKILNKGRDPFVDVTKQMIYYRDKEDAFQKRMSGETLPLPVEASEKLGKIIIKACDYNPIHRYKNAEEFRKALKIAMKPERASPCIKPDKNKKTSKDKKKKKINVTKIIMIPLVVFVLGLGIWGVNKVVKKRDLNEFSISDDTTWKEIEAEENSAEEEQEAKVNSEEYEEETVNVSDVAGFEIAYSGKIKRWINKNKLKEILEKKTTATEENIDKIVENFKDQLKFNVDIENLKLGDEIILRYEPDVNYLEILANAQIKLKFSNKHVIYKN